MRQLGGEQSGENIQTRILTLSQGPWWACADNSWWLNVARRTNHYCVSRFT